MGRPKMYRIFSERGIGPETTVVFLAVSTIFVMIDSVICDQMLLNGF
jgi:hypothetical protein